MARIRRMLRPPTLACAMQTYQAPSRAKEGGVMYTARAMPAVLHNAFRSPDGAEAVVLANPTLAPQHVTLTWHGKVQELNVPATGAVLVR